MVLNYIWAGFLIIAFIVALIKLLFTQDTAVFSAMLQATFDMSKTGFELSIGLTGLMAFWLGIMKIGEKGGMVTVMARLVGPFFARLFPEIPRDHPAIGSMIMNFSANLLGLDNAATPLGLKAMDELQSINDQKDTATNAQIMFLVLNTSGLSIIPLSIMLDRSLLGANNPSDVFIPILLTTFSSTVIGIIAVSIYQKINLFDRVIFAYLGGLTLFMGLIVLYFSRLSPEEVEEVSKLSSSVIIFTIIISFLVLGLVKKINIYEIFIEGAKGGFEIAIKIVPYLIAILVAIGVFRASGAMDLVIQAIVFLLESIHINTDFVPALPTALMKPLSGSGARGMMIEVIKAQEEAGGADSFVGRMASMFRGATETTFYIIAVYFGAVNIRKTRYAITVGLIADLAGIITAIFVGYLFFH